MATAAILSFENRLPFLYYWTNIHQIWWDCCESDLKRKCHIKTTYSTKIKMAVAAIMNIRKLLLFLFYWTNPHQFQWECWESDIERNCLVKNKSQHGGCRHFQCWKTMLFPWRLKNIYINLLPFTEANLSHANSEGGLWHTSNCFYAIRVAQPVLRKADSRFLQPRCNGSRPITCRRSHSDKS